MDLGTKAGLGLVLAGVTQGFMVMRDLNVLSALELDGARRYGPAPKAFLSTTLAGAFFVDLANSLVAKAFMAPPMIGATAPVIAG